MTDDATNIIAEPNIERKPLDVMTKQGVREVCFMEIDQKRFMDICGGKHG